VLREAESRLDLLRESGSQVLAPLWIERLPAAEALRELEGREGALFGVQRVRFLLDLGRTWEARSVLAELGELPPGLDRISLELRKELAKLEESGKLPDLQRERLEFALQLWLHRVRGWRGAHGELP
jgi:hypothetical protein